MNSDEEDVADLLVQAEVAPRTDLISRTIGEVDFRQRYGALVVSLWRKEGWLQQELAHTRLSAGDVLVLQGDAEALARVESDPAFLMLVPFHGEPRRHRKAALAGGIMLASVVAAAFNLLPIEMAALAGAVAMVLSGCLSARQAYQAIDVRIYVFIAGAIPLGTSMQQSGTVDLLAGWLQTALHGWSQMLILLALFAVVAVITQLMSDAATTALFAPVAVILAQALGHPPEPYVVTVAMAAVVSFLTPIGHHGNLLVYGPGGYRFTDFVRVGTPLTVLVALIVTWLAPLLWPQ
jgi:di/tricarboxylate transporter